MKKVIDLSGEWGLFLDKYCTEMMPDPNDTITLPDTTSHAQKGEYNPRRETGFLTDTYLFEGNAWFSKIIEIKELENCKTFLFLERTRITQLYIDGNKIGSCESLCAPHIYDITSFVSNGSHRFDICVSNTGYKTAGGHLTSPDTQTNWNGITGKIELRAYSENHLRDIMVFPDVKSKSIRITANTTGSSSGQVTVSAQGYNTKRKHCVQPEIFEYTQNRLDVVYQMGENALLWDEHEPNLYKVSISIGEDKTEITVGLRQFQTDGNKFSVNGKKVFLRGKHDGMIFPKTGFAPTDVNSWLEVMKISKSYGINHYRFHTCCPPEAAFEAADILGIYLQPELPFWGTITSEGEENHNPEEQQFLIDEGFRMLKAYGNHPSFCMMSLGNELWGSKEKLNKILGKYKKFDNRHLYTQGSNNFQWCPCVLENDDFFVGVRLSRERLLRGSYAMCDAPQGHIQTQKPSTTHSFDNAVLSKSQNSTENGEIQIQYGTGVKTVKAQNSDEEFYPQIPIITHEIGQYETYPDFNEIEKYTGSIKARNLEIFRERLTEKGMLSQSEDFFYCSGQLAAQCYKQELEAAFRSKSIAGFQLLDLQDFSGQGTALVGILDAFMEDKGIISAEAWRGFCSDAVLTAKFDSFVYEENQAFSADITLTYFGASKNECSDLLWRLSDEQGNNLYCGHEKIYISNGQNYFDICKINIQLPSCQKPQTLKLILKSEDLKTENCYNIYVFPKLKLPDLDKFYIFETLNDEAKKALEKGRRILLIRNPKQVENAIKGCYCTDFWCYPMFKSISQSMGMPEPIGTMGLVIQNNHSALAQFICEKFTTPQWWEIVTNSCSEILDEDYEGKNIIIQTIDNFERNHRLGLLYEYSCYEGQVVVCNCDIEKLKQSIEGRQFIYSLLSYIDRL